MNKNDNGTSDTVSWGIYFPCDMLEFFDFIQRQRQRGFRGSGRAISFYEGIDMLMPIASLVLFFVDGIGYWLILGGEPLLNSRALVEVVWSIRLTSGRYTNT